jgi:hypothetical protein
MPPLDRLRVAIVGLTLLFLVSPLCARSYEARRLPERTHTVTHGFSFAEVWMRIIGLWEKEGSSLDPMGLAKPNPPATPAGPSPSPGVPLAPQ